MKSVLDTIKHYPECFEATCYARSRTTSNLDNYNNHCSMLSAINTKDWSSVVQILEQGNYTAAFEGVLYCLSAYSDIPNEVWHKVIDLYDENKLF